MKCVLFLWTNFHVVQYSYPTGLEIWHNVYNYTDLSRWCVHFRYIVAREICRWYKTILQKTTKVLVTAMYHQLICKILILANCPSLLHLVRRCKTVSLSPNTNAFIKLSLFEHFVNSAFNKWQIWYYHHNVKSSAPLISLKSIKNS